MNTILGMLLAQVSEYRLAEMATDPVYVARIRKLAEQFDEYMATALRFQISRSDSDRSSQPRTSRRLFLRRVWRSQFAAALFGRAWRARRRSSQVGKRSRLPLVAVGLLYHYGYFRQRLNPVGWQEEFYGETDPDTVTVASGED